MTRWKKILLWLVAITALGLLCGQVYNYILQSGSVTAGHCVSWVSSGVVQDAGAACGAGGGVSAGTAGQIGYYAADGSTISGDAKLDDGASTANTLTYTGSAGINLTGTNAAVLFNGAGPHAAINDSENAGPAATAGRDKLWADSTNHRWTMNNNGGSNDTVVGAATTDALTNKTYNGLTVTTTTGTLTIASGKTATISNTLTFAGTDGNSFTFPSGSGTVVIQAASQNLSNKTLTSPILATTAVTSAAGFHFNQNGASGDLAGTVTLSGGAGTHNFSTAFASAPVCVCTDTTATNVVRCSTSTTALTVAGTTTDVIAYACYGNPN